MAHANTGTLPGNAFVSIAVIGDVHLAWDEADIAYFESSDYDLILFVGDLASFTFAGALRTARRIARLRRPTLVIPGNHDAVHAPQLVSEVLRWKRLSHLLSFRMGKRCSALRQALAPVPLCGYSHHAFAARGLAWGVIAARPHSMGGPTLGYARHLRQTFGIRSMEESAERLCRLVDEAEHERLLFLAHNGPSGLGSSRHDIWGCDFRPEEGDFGDPDLRVAIDHARARDRKVLAVAAGHMHHRLRGGGSRITTLERNGVLYVNAARVSRIFEQHGRRRRHHVRIETDGEHTEAREVLVPAR